MEDLIKALKNYSSNKTLYGGQIPALTKKIESLGDISDYVRNITNINQIIGKEPIVSVIEEPKNQTPVKLDLYWNIKRKILDFDWTD